MARQQETVADRHMLHAKQRDKHVEEKPWHPIFFCMAPTVLVLLERPNPR